MDNLELVSFQIISAVGVEKSFYIEAMKIVPNILLMHAEDQLMSAETIKMMALEIIKLNQRLYSLEK